MFKDGDSLGPRLSARLPSNRTQLGLLTSRAGARLLGP
jgi:hypothetical protein